MSWLEKINSGFVITTGDGLAYRPYWVNASKNIEFNLTEYKFIGIAGTYVDRRERMGTRFAIEVLFQGDDHLSQSEAFEQSAADRAPWLMEHPLYGNLLVQPLSLTFDNSADNVSRITGMVVQTLTKGRVTASVISPIDQISASKISVDNKLIAAVSIQMPVLSAKNNATILSSMSAVYSDVSAKIKDSTWKNSFFNAYNKVNTQVNSRISDVVGTMFGVRDLLSMPYRFSDTLKDRINMFQSQLSLLAKSVTTAFTRGDKKLYESSGGFTLGSLALAAVTNIGTEYTKALDTLSIIDIISSSYNEYLENLDSMQSANGGSPDSYIPDADALTELSALIDLTTGTLLEIASRGKQQRMVVLDADTNPILLASRLYGYKGDDSVIEDIINDSNIGLNELLMIPKGRTITYYI